LTPSAQAMGDPTISTAMAVVVMSSTHFRRSHRFEL
jgi:hypothetical protein